LARRPGRRPRAGVSSRDCWAAVPCGRGAAAAAAASRASHAWRVMRASSRGTLWRFSQKPTSAPAGREARRRHARMANSEWRMANGEWTRAYSLFANRHSLSSLEQIALARIAAALACPHDARGREGGGGAFGPRRHPAVGELDLEPEPGADLAGRTQRLAARVADECEAARQHATIGEGVEQPAGAVQQRGPVHEDRARRARGPFGQRLGAF